MLKNLSEGARYALLAYTAWGLFPLYWKLLGHLPALAIFGQRVFWSLVFYSLMRAVWRRERMFSFRLLPRQWWGIALSSLLIGSNWLLYIWAVNTDHIVETSLGYFINPLVNILLGVVFLHERLTRPQKIAVLLALAGVLVLTVEGGRLPWIALALAATFSLYGFTRKKIGVPTLEGAQLEALLMLAPVALLVSREPFAWGTVSWVDWGFLVGAGVVTGLPLLWFIEAAKRLPYYLMGFFQYIAPTLQFLTGVVIFHEPLTTWKLVGFAFIWAGIFLTLQDGVRSLRRSRPR
ncbi:MAG: EamA family transporter RarD [Bdellovibrionaceae bacterium]|nr:EamA family transporter RarD [Pseudobdellovibrionaceae bacterium]